MDQEAIDWVESQVDIQSFMDWLLVEIFLNNRDIVNVRYWRSSAPDSKWRWILYDLDMTLGSASEDAFFSDVVRGFSSRFWSTILVVDEKSRDENEIFGESEYAVATKLPSHKYFQCHIFLSKSLRTGNEGR